MGVNKVFKNALEDDILCYQCIRLQLEDLRWVCQVSFEEVSIKGTCKSPLKTRRI